MSLASRRCLGPLVVGLALAFAPSAAADPDITTQSASAVIDQLRHDGYTVQVNGVSSSDTSMLISCKVVEIHHLGGPAAKDVHVDVACPISHE